MENVYTHCRREATVCKSECYIHISIEMTNNSGSNCFETISHEFTFTRLEADVTRRVKSSAMT